MNETQVLAKFATELQWDDIPLDVREHVKATLFNYLAVGIGGSRTDTADIAIQTWQLLAMPGKAPVLGCQQSLHPLQAAFINGISAHVDDFDDTHLATVIHPGAPVISAALAVAAEVEASGQELLTAIAAGCEVALRIGLSVTPEHYDLGWHITGTCGVFGAAAAAGWLMNLSPEQMMHAFGLSCTQASGVRDAFGTMTKSLHIGHAASNGVRAALLTKEGFTAAENILDGPHSFSRVYAGVFHPDALTENLGTQWETLSNTFKPYPCGVVIHPVIDAGIALHNALIGDWQSIQHVTLEANPLVLELTGKFHPQTELDGKFSSYFCLAAALVDGEVGVDQFSQETIANPAIHNLQDLIDIQVDSRISREACRVVAVLQDGSRKEVTIQQATGSLENPLTESGLRTKARNLIDPILGEGQHDVIFRLVSSLAEREDIAELVSAVLNQEGVDVL